MAPLQPPFKGLPPVGGGSFSTVPQITGVSPSSARSTGGSSHTLSGYNFVTDGAGNQPVVTVGGVAALNVVVVDVNTITFDMPVVSFTGITDITVTTIGGTGTLFQVFNVFSSTLVAINPTFGSIAGGYQATVTGYNFVTGSTFTVGGLAATGVTFIDPEHYVITIPAHGAGFVDVVITDPGGATHTLRNGFQYTLFTRGEDIRRKPGIRINDSLNNTPNTADFVVDGDSNVPFVGEEIEITDSEDGDRLLFRGTVQAVTQNFEGQIDQLNFGVRCVDFTFLLNKYRPFGKFTATSVSDIVKALISKYAPDFTTDHVQTNLAKVTMEFDGGRDLATCLTDLARAIGGGHWYVDYERDVHFFHVVPPGSLIPSLPDTSVNQDFGTPMTVAEGSLIPSTFSYTRGWYRFSYTIVYDNNLESALGPWTDWIYLDGTKQITLSDIPLGSVIGSINPSKRRIYVNRMMHYAQGVPKHSFDTIERYVQIDDVVTASFTSWYADEEPDVATVVNIPGTEPLPRKPFAGHPNGPTSAPKADVVTWTSSRAMSAAAFRVAFMYRDGSISYAGPASGLAWTPTIWTPTETVIAWNGFTLTNIPTGPQIDGVDCVARLIYFGYLDSEKYPPFSVAYPANLGGGGLGIPFPEGTSPAPVPDWNPARTTGVILVGDNERTSATWTAMAGVGSINYDRDTPVGGGRQLPFYKAGPGGLELEPDPIPVWPNNDGPWLEDDERPDDINDENDDLLFTPQITVTRDHSQTRNRVYLVGRGTSLTEPASVGDTELQVADGNAFSAGGGSLSLRGKVYDYYTVSGADGVWVVTLVDPISTNASSGETVANFLQLDDIDAQKELGKIELDSDGRVTDGVHEYTVVDASLKTRFQMYSRAQAELELYARPVVTVTYSTRDPKSRSGRLVNIDLTDPPVSGEFLIQSVTIDQVRDEGDQLSPRYNVRASSVKFDLNDLLLQILGRDNHVQGSSVGIAAKAAETAALATTDGGVNYRVVSIILTPKMLIDMRDTGDSDFLLRAIEIAPAPGPGKYNVWMWWAIEKRTGTGDNTSSGHSIILRTQNPSTGYNTVSLGLNNTNRTFQFRANDPSGIGIRNGPSNGLIDGENEPLYLIRDTGAISGFTETDLTPIVKITLCYFVVDLNTAYPPYTT